MTRKVKLGKKYRDTVTGFEGIAVAVTEWMNGCKRVFLEGEHTPGEKPGQNEVTVDIERLVQVEMEKSVPVGGRGGGGRPDVAARGRQTP